jgi:double-strand break repair protein MRE11
MPSLAESVSDTIRILVATDNHVGYEERHPIRGEDSWKAFHEIMCLAKERDVDMVLLAGDLFHENKPSRKAMYKVMQSLRMNCFGEKPCELEMLSEGSEQFEGLFDHANFEDEDINVAIPVFSIHGNHDDPSGQGHLAALDILQMSGLLNYYGRTPESDKITVRPVLLQKGKTKLALYGLSNVRDERLYRTFKREAVEFLRPETQTEDWFNLICVHQNHHAYTETSYLPESFLESFLDLVIWGHEHECLIEPRLNPDMKFKVMQPGSSIATSLVASEAVPKHVAIVSITGRDFKSEPIRLKTVRPFIFKDFVLAQDKDACKIAKKDEHKSELTRLLMAKVEELIEQAQADWLEAQEEGGAHDGDEEIPDAPLPLIRLRVDTTPPESGIKFDCENPQRFSNRFMERVANTNDVIQFHQKKKTAVSGKNQKATDVDPEVMSAMQGLDTIKVDKLVREFLAAQSLTILPQNYFGDAVSQYVDKGDGHAMEEFVKTSLKSQMKQLVDTYDAVNQDEGSDEDELATQIEKYRIQTEDAFAKGTLKRTKSKARYKPKPEGWDSDFDGEWEDQPAALLRPDEPDEAAAADSDASVMPPPKTAGRGRGRVARGGAAASTRKSAAPPKKPAARGKKKVVDDDDDDDDDDEDSDVMMLDDDDAEENSQSMFFTDNTQANGKSTSTRGRKAATTTTRATRASPAPKKAPARAAAVKGKQGTLSFTNSQASVLGNGKGKARSQSVEEISDDSDAFEPAPSSARSRR